MSDVSIIIVSWNTREILRECLHSIYKETVGIEFDVILVDNASADNTVEMVREEFPQVILIPNSENRGFAAANNQGIAIAKRDYVLLLNPDTVVLDNAIQKSIVFADEHPNAGVVGIRNDDAEGKLTKNCFQFASVLNLLISTLGLHRAFPKSRFFGRERLSWWDYSESRQVDVVAGCYMLVRKTVIDAVGGLDEKFFMYGEEMDWCWRIKKAGWDVWYYSDAKIIHYGGMSAAQNPIEMHKQGLSSFFYFIEKRQGRLARYIASALIVVNGIMRAGFWSCRWIVSSGVARDVSAQKLRQALTMVSLQ